MRTSQLVNCPVCKGKKCPDCRHTGKMGRVYATIYYPELMK